MSKNEKGDFDIIQEVLNGNVNSFEILVARYERMIYSLCFTKTKDRETALDLSQECFLKVYKMLATFKSTSAFSTWIYSICRNLIIDYFRKNKNKYDTISLSYYEDNNIETKSREFDVPDTSLNPEQVLITKEREQIVREAIQSLPTTLSEILILRDIKNLSYEEISDMLEIDLGTVKSRIFRGREKLKKILKDKIELF